MLVNCCSFGILVKNDLNLPSSFSIKFVMSFVIEATVWSEWCIFKTEIFGAQFSNNQTWGPLSIVVQIEILIIHIAIAKACTERYTHTTIPSMFYLFFFGQWHFRGEQEVEEGSRIFCFRPSGLQSVAALFQRLLLSSPLPACPSCLLCSISSITAAPVQHWGARNFPEHKGNFKRQVGAVEQVQSGLKVRDVQRYLLNFRRNKNNSQVATAYHN